MIGRRRPPHGVGGGVCVCVRVGACVRLGLPLLKVPTPLQELRLLVNLLLLVNVAKLFSSLTSLRLSCELANDAFARSSFVPSAARCHGSLFLVSMFGVIVYSAVSSAQIQILARLEWRFMVKLFKSRHFDALEAGGFFDGANGPGISRPERPGGAAGDAERRAGDAAEEGGTSATASVLVEIKTDVADGQPLRGL